MNTENPDFAQRAGSLFADFTQMPVARRALIGMLAILGAHAVCYIIIEASMALGDNAAIDGSIYRRHLLTWIAGIFAFLGICLWYDRRRPNARFPLYVIAYGYGGTWILNSALLGTVDHVYSAFVIGYAMAMILLDGLAFSIRALAFWTVLTAATLVAQWLNWIPHAPMVVDNSLEARNTIAYIVPAFGWLLVIVVFDTFLFWLVWQSQRLTEDRLKHSNNLIRRYLPPAVADRITSGRDAEVSTPQRRRVTIMFADIVGFTDVADRVEPEVMTEVLNDYLSSMAELIQKYGGTLNEFAGDGLMALFGAPDEMPAVEQARNAVAAARGMQAAMPALNQRWRQLGLGTDLSIRIGINTGMASVGSYGSQGRMTYTAIGLQTNIASRIETHCKPGEILLSEATWQLVRDDVKCEDRGEIEVKGVHFPVAVHAVQP